MYVYMCAHTYLHTFIHICLHPSINIHICTDSYMNIHALYIEKSVMGMCRVEGFPMQVGFE